MPYINIKITREGATAMSVFDRRSLQWPHHAYQVGSSTIFRNRCVVSTELKSDCCMYESHWIISRSMS
jgi:hypothetical protein